MNNFGSDYATGIGAPGWVHAVGLGLLVITLWSLFWKGLALWHAGQKSDVKWFIVLLIVNTCGILDIIYLFLVCRLKFDTLFTRNSDAHAHHHHGHTHEN